MHTKGFRESENEKLSNKTFDIINRLGLVDAGLIASCILRVIEEYPSYNKEMDMIFKRTTRSEKEIIATRKYNEFCTSYYWEFKKSDDEVDEECKHLLYYAEFLSPKDIFDLLDFMEKTTVLKKYVDKFRDSWIVKQKTLVEGFHSYYNLAEIRHDIQPHIAAPFENIEEHTGVKDAIEHVSLYKHAGERQRAVFRSSTVSSIKDEIYAFSGTELKDFISHVGSISQPYIVSSLSLEDITHKLREAAESIISENRYPRLTFVLEQRLDQFVSARTATDGGESSGSEPACVRLP